jgi:hypothetical protein
MAVAPVPQSWQSRQLRSHGSRASSAVTENVNRKRAEPEPAFALCIIIHLEQLLYDRFSVEKDGRLAALSESSRKSGCPRGIEQERAMFPRLRKARNNSS